MPQSENLPPDEFSRSNLKREVEAIHKIGEMLVNMPETQLNSIPLPDKVREAIDVARSIHAREGKRRQLQYIGKLMRQIDLEPIKAAMQKVHLVKAKETEQFHEVEEWRDKLISEGDTAIQSFMDIHADADRQKIRQLVRQAQHDRKSQKNTGAETALFRYLRELLS